MTELLSKSHTIIERPLMEFPPFGVNEQGEKIDDISGVLVRGKIEYLEESVSKLSGPQAGVQAVQELCRLLNERIPDPVFHVTPEFLKNVWHSYSYEFVSYLRVFCANLSGSPANYHFNAAKEKQLPPSIAILAKSFSTSQICHMFPYFADKYARGLVECEVGPITDCSAILRMKLTKRATRQAGAYLKSCADISCQTTKGLLSSIPERVHGLPPATVKDRTCIANGDEWCEWQVAWQPHSREGFMKVLQKLFKGCFEQKSKPK
jgi:hypothetical protein